MTPESHPFPLFDLRIRTPRLELRLPTDDELVALMQLARNGVHEPDLMPFAVPWTRRPSPQFEWEFLQHHWSQRAAIRPGDWALLFGVFEHGTPVGSQSLHAKQFGVCRTVETGSWVSQVHQGKGIGTEMRTAVLHLAFEGLDALRAESGALLDNPSSMRVSEKVGYVDNGTRIHELEGKRVTERLFVLERERWQARRRDDITITGLDPCRELLLSPTDTDAADRD